jgi:hypothetical protein
MAWCGGLLFIWVGIAALANLGWGVGLLGVGIIGLAAQVVRATHLGLPVEGFGVVVAIFFFVGGAWELLTTYLGDVQIPGGLLPILSIVLGLVLVAAVFFRRAKY